MTNLKMMLLAFVCSLSLCFSSWGSTPPWSTEKAYDWYNNQAWIIGSNFIPSNASNQFDFWQAETFDPKRIDLELSWAHSLGMNTMRVFIHDLLWKDDPEGLIKRMNQLLEISDSYGIRILFVLFDSCWDSNPVSGPQKIPRPGTILSNWAQGPGLSSLKAASVPSAERERLKNYVTGVVDTFKNDPRILAWDIWNEPDIMNWGSYNDPQEKLDYVKTLLPLVFDWAHSVNPIQPITSPIHTGDWASYETLNDIQKIQMTLSDVITFHDYSDPVEFERRVKQLENFKRPFFCTEYMARTRASTFQGILPIALGHGIGMMNWGFVAGKTQSYFSWDTWGQPSTEAYPPLWFHDIFYPDGQAYNEDEVSYIRSLTLPGSQASILQKK